MFRFETAGESHGECLVATLTGLPAGIPISLAEVNRELWRRQQGYGRGGRMKIETDTAEIVAGVRHPPPSARRSPSSSATRTGRTGPKSCRWKTSTAAEDKKKPVTRPRPGHADLAGAIKYNFHDARYILERASARETTARVAVGAIAKALLEQFGIEVLSHVIAVGPVRLERAASWDELVALSRRDEVLLGCVDPEAEARMKAVVDEAYRTGDTVGGVFEVVAHGVPAGPRLARHLGLAPRRAAGAGHRLHAGGEGRRGRVRRGRRAQLRLQGAGHDPLQTRGAPLHPRRQSRRRPRRRHDQRPGHPGARLAEADLDAAPAAGIGGS